MSLLTRAPPFWRVLERWREKHGRMPRRRSGHDVSDKGRRDEEALAKRVERWLRESALPPALDIQLKAWVEAERCGDLLGQVAAFHALRGRMPQRRYSDGKAGRQEDNLARRVKRYCETARPGAGYASESASHQNSPGDDVWLTLCMEQQISDCGRLSTMLSDVSSDCVCLRVRRMFDIISMHRRTAGCVGEWRFVLMICVSAGLRTLSDFGSADLTPLSQLSCFRPAVKKAIPRVSAIARCFRILEAGSHLELRTISEFLTVDEELIGSFVTLSGLNEHSVRSALSEMGSVVRHVWDESNFSPLPGPKRLCQREDATRASVGRHIADDAVLASGITVHSIPSALLPRLCAELQCCVDKVVGPAAQLPNS